MEITCINCGQSLSVPDDHYNKVIRCGGCRTEQTAIPQTPALAQHPSPERYESKIPQPDPVIINAGPEKNSFQSCMGCIGGVIGIIIIIILVGMILATNP